MGGAGNVPDGELAIRLARESDAPEILKIYEPYVLGTVITFEYDVPSVQEFAARIRHTLERFPYLVAVLDGEIVGYAYASPFKTRAAYDWAVETSIYVKTELRGRGVGARLYRALEQELGRMNILNLNACIGYPNPESIGFHEKFGYKIVGHFTQCGFKLGAWHDMVWMEKFIGEHSVPPRAVTPYPLLPPR
jgi:phosphinothricin acetyltransferase